MNPPPAHGEWNVSNADYHANRTHISASGVKTFLTSVEDFHFEYVLSQKPKLSKDAAEKRKKELEQGTALHTLLLEGEEAFKESILPWPEGNGNATIVKTARAECLEEQKATGKTILTYPEEMEVREWAANIAKNPRIASFLDLSRPGMSEATYTFELEHLPFKVRFDRLIRIEPQEPGEIWKPDTFLDIKTCQDCRPEAFSSDFYKFNYHIQAFVYREGFKAIFGEYPAHIYYFALDKKNAHRSPVDFKLDEVWFELARWKVLQACGALEFCRFTGDWSGPYAKETQVLKPPYWAMSAMEREIRGDD